MAFLEKTVAGTGDTIVDMNIAAFIAARADRKVEMQVDALLRAKDGEALRRGELALLQQLQVRYHPGPMPGLAAWAAARLRPPPGSAMLPPPAAATASCTQGASGRGGGAGRR